MTAVQTADPTPLVNPLAALNQEAYDAEHHDAANMGIAALTERAKTLRGDLEAAVREAGDDFDVGKVTHLKGDTHTATLGNMVDHHSRISAVQAVLNQKRAIQAQIRRQAARDGRDEGDDLYDEFRDTGRVTGGFRPRVSPIVASLRAATKERGINYVEAARQNAVFDLDVDPRIVGALADRGAPSGPGGGGTGSYGNQWDDADYPPWSDHSGRVVALGRAPLTYLDVVPIGTIGQAMHIYDRESTPATSTASGTDAARVGSSAAARAEAAVLAESNFTWTRQADRVESIGHQWRATMEQLDDAPRLESLVNGKMMWGVRQRINIEIANGTGATPRIKGFEAYRHDGTADLATARDQFSRVSLDASVASTRSAAGLEVMHVAKRMETVLQTEGAAMATALVMHPRTWEIVCLTETGSAGFYFGDPRLANGPKTLWGIPVVEDQYGMSAFDETTAAGNATRLLMGDFAMHSEFLYRHGVRVEFGMSATDFENLVTRIRAYVRGVLSVYRIKAFVQANVQA